MHYEIDLIRDVLLQVERRGAEPGASGLSVEGLDERSMRDYIQLLDSLGYVQATTVWTFTGEVVSTVRLTWKGLDFVTRTRDETTWSRVKKRANRGNDQLPLGDLLKLLDEASFEN